MVGGAHASRVQVPASRRKTMFGETPNTTRGTRMLPKPLAADIILGT